MTLHGDSVKAASEQTKSPERVGAFKQHAPKWIRTTGLILRRDALYPAELWAPSRPTMPACRPMASTPFIVCGANHGKRISRVLSSKRRRMTASGRRIIYLGPRLLDVSSSLPGTLDAVRNTARVAPRPLFGLAPSGVCLAAAVTSPRGGLLHHLFTLACALFGPSAVNSLWHFPSPYDARPLAGTLPFGARTFLESWRLAPPLAIHTRFPELSNSNASSP
jgi:hypothetical protein